MRGSSMHRDLLEQINQFVHLDDSHDLRDARVKFKRGDCRLVLAFTRWWDRTVELAVFDYYTDGRWRVNPRLSGATKDFSREPDAYFTASTKWFKEWSHECVPVLATPVADFQAHVRADMDTLAAVKLLTPQGNDMLQVVMQELRLRAQEQES